jgi:hypothetical protein
VYFGLIVDRKLVPHPSRIIERFQPELENLIRLALMLPSDGRPSSRAAEDFLDYALGEP